MKQKRDDPMFAFPKERPKTIRGLHRWHRKLLEDCVYFEFEKRALEAGVGHINREIQKYVRWLREDEPESAAVLALDRLQRLKGEWKEDLATVKQVIRVLHDTNEWIIRSLLLSRGGEEMIRQFDERRDARTGNLLHEPGWLTEVRAMQDQAKQGRAVFLTFGTMFDARGFDMLVFPSLGSRIKWRGAWPPARRKRSRSR
jgi:hypothetical protein